MVTTDGLAGLYDRHAAALFSYCARRVGPDLAEDIVASTFLTAHERRHRYDPSRPPLPWLYGIATNLLRRHRRDEVRAYRALVRTGVDPLTGVHAVADEPAQRAAERTDDAARARRIAGVLLDLPVRQRDVLLLFAVGQLRYGEIAEAMDIPVGSVRSALHRARTTLRAALERGES